ncbi:MAG TPA: hypothetical protein VGT79_09650 [Xanthomonadaceae bacterium]|nr:hypothetical protein [Xanthomonadaceae bacterium]
MILGYSRLFPPDASELALPDAASARALVSARRPDILDWMQHRRRRLLEHFGDAVAPTLDPAADAFLLGLARIGLRHGSFGNDFHVYHNENHVLEIADRRLRACERALGYAAMPLASWLKLALFAACHDLRQREPIDVPGPIGGNEAASIAETLRILDTCGYSREHDRDLYIAMEIMIAGSTFGLFARPLANSAEAAIGGGALAQYLPGWLDQAVPEWRRDPMIESALILARLAADLDTANAAESFAELADSALRLCREREMRDGRSLDSPESAQPCLSFLSKGQERFFFELHQFSSREGERVFGPGKLANAPRVRAVSAALRARFATEPPANGNAVIAAYTQLAG